jgi:hypothetical protein
MPYVSPAWPTRDHVIPWRLFRLGHQQLEHVTALQRLSMTRAVHVGGLLASPAKSKTAAITRERRLLAEDRAAAFPGEPEDSEADED